MSASGRPGNDPARRAPLAVRLSALVAGVALTWAIGEVAVRLGGGARGFYDVEMWRYARALKVDPGWPGVDHWHRPSARVRAYGTELATNRFGMRNPEIDEAPGAGVERVTVLGDSITLGWGVDEAESFPRLTERLLAETTPPGALRIEVLNFGIGNVNTAVEGALYVHLARRFHARRVVLAYFVNDAEATAQASDGFGAFGSQLVVWGWSRLFRAHARFDARAGYEAYYSSLYAEAAPGWMATREALARLAHAVAKDGASLTVMLIPELHRLGEPRPFAREYARVAELARADGARVLDLWSEFAGRDARTLWVSDEDAHPNAAGHAIIAEALARDLTRGAAPEPTPEAGAP